jgi:ASC-1-like (ASCH) protein
MLTIPLNVQEPYLSFILNGQKTVEGRSNKGKLKDLKVGDKLSIGSDEKLFMVKQINYYDSFRNMIVGEGLKSVIPDKNTVEDAEAIYYKFYTREQEKEFGVLAIKMEVL